MNKQFLSESGLTTFVSQIDSIYARKKAVEDLDSIVKKIKENNDSIPDEINNIIKNKGFITKDELVIYFNNLDSELKESISAISKFLKDAEFDKTTEQNEVIDTLQDIISILNCAPAKGLKTPKILEKLEALEASKTQIDELSTKVDKASKQAASALEMAENADKKADKFDGRISSLMTIVNNISNNLDKQAAADVFGFDKLGGKSKIISELKVTEDGKLTGSEINISEIDVNEILKSVFSDNK